ncbi:hypothetical protein [Sediminitomix flava]|uniref:DUF2116 family Zn-ribbon domain-containing protein n=1 Tax=Sediminitomix flava TaxID=379075 RepID=A0A315ZCG9_SEDFL|nr:hypothetical protein [Sediminitomix flava]PWJ42434.1 hypothetical protein BC781_103686 [Sediminitomix flava]
MPNLCQYCNTPLTVGRIDRKFCDSKCKASYHNQHRKQIAERELSINKLLRRNRNILKKACPEGKATIRKDILDSHGFSFEYFSNLYLTQKGHVYYFSYEYGYSPVKEGHIEKVLIVKWQDYMMKFNYDPWKKL